MKLSVQVGSTSQSVNVFIQDSSSTTGAGLSGLVYNTSGLTAYYGLPRAAAAAISLATLAAVTSAYSSGGFKEIDATNMKGWYRFDIPDAALASGRFVSIHLQGAANMAPCPIEIELTGWNNQDSVRAGLTALPNAAAEASGGLATLSAAQASNGTINANVHRWLTGTPNALQSGRVDGYLGAVASGVIAAASFAANALDAVWSTATRLLTAGTNIVLAKGTGVTGFNDLDAAGIRSATGLASANLDTQLSGINSKTTNLPSDPADASDIAGSFSTVNSTLETIAAYIDTEVAAIKAKTDNLPSDPADASDIAASFTSLASTLSTIAGYIDTEVAAIKAKTDNLPSDPADASDVAAAVSASTSTLSTLIDALPTNAELATALAAADDAVLAAIAALNNIAAGAAMTLTTGERDAIAAALLDLANGVETGITVRKSLRLANAANGGKTAGAATTSFTVRNPGDSKDRITATVDEDGNRTDVTLDLT